MTKRGRAMPAEEEGAGAVLTMPEAEWGETGEEDGRNEKPEGKGEGEWKIEPDIEEKAEEDEVNSGVTEERKFGVYEKALESEKADEEETIESGITPPMEAATKEEAE